MGLDPAQAADQKINTPAVQRKEKGGDWKVSKQDLAKADEKNMTSAAGMAALKKKISTVEEGEFAGDYATGEAGQWRNKGPKAHKPATIGDLVGENFINTDVQAVVSEKMDSDGSDDLARILNIAGIKK